MVTSVRPKGHLSESNFLGFRKWLHRLYPGIGCFGEIEIGFRVLYRLDLEGVVEGFGAISSSTLKAQLLSRWFW